MGHGTPSYTVKKMSHVLDLMSAMRSAVLTSRYFNIVTGDIKYVSKYKHFCKHVFKKAVANKRLNETPEIIRATERHHRSSEL